MVSKLYIENALNPLKNKQLRTQMHANLIYYFVNFFYYNLDSKDKYVGAQVISRMFIKIRQ